MSAFSRELAAKICSSTCSAGSAACSWALGSSAVSVLDEQPNRAVLVRVQRFEKSIVYTLVNEGEADTVRLLDLETGRRFRCALDAGHGIKFWLSPDGELLDAFLGGDSRLEAAED